MMSADFEKALEIVKVKEMLKGAVKEMETEDPGNDAA